MCPSTEMTKSRHVLLKRVETENDRGRDEWGEGRKNKSGRVILDIVRI